MSCTIKYIDNTSLSEEAKQNKVKEHVASLRELLAFKEINFESLKRKRKQDGETIKYVLAPYGELRNKFNEYVEGTEYLKDNIRYVTINGKEAIVIDTIGESELTSDLSDLFAQEHELRHSKSITNTNEDLESILDNDESRKTLYTIINDLVKKLDILIDDPDTNSRFRDELKVIRRGLDDENNIYSIESATNFIKYAIEYSKRYSKKFKGKNSYLKQLEEIQKLPTFDERKRARAFLTREVEYLKNKFYIFGALNKISDQLSFASTELDDVFETYNRYTIQNKLQKLTANDDKLDEIKKVISGAYKNELELKEKIDELELGLTSKEIKEIISSSVFSSMLDENGEVKQTLLGQVKKAQDDLYFLRDSIKTYMVEAQVDLLHDASVTYLPEATTAYAKKFEMTKDKIRQSIFQASGNIGLLDYNLKQGDQLPDEVLSLFTTLLHSTIMESDYLAFNELQRINKKFDKFNSRIDEYSELAQTYTFEIPNKWEPQFYKKVKINGEDFLAYTAKVKNEAGVVVDEEKTFPLPKESVYGRYFKLNEANDDNWAYLSDQGYYVRVIATKALEGKNQNHRIDNEWAILNKKIDEIAQQVIDEGEILLYPKEGSMTGDTIIKSTSPNGYAYSKKYIMQLLRNAFNDKYKNTLSKEDSLIKNNELFDVLNSNPTLEVRKNIFKKDFKRKDFLKHKASFFETALDRQKAESTWLIALNIDPANARYNEYLVETKDGDVINVTVDISINDASDHTYQMYHNGVLVDESTIDSILTKGDSYKIEKEDTVLIRPEFKAAMQNPDFKEFFEQITEEYDKIADQDSSGFLNNGKLGQVVTDSSKTFMEALKEFKDNENKTAALANASYEGIKKFLNTDGQKKFPKTDAKGNFVDAKGNILPKGARPYMVRRDSLNIDGLEIDELAPTFAKRVFNQNFVTNNLLTNIMAMSSQSINFSRMYELEPQMRYAMLLSQGSNDLNIDQRQVVSHVKSKKNEQNKKLSKEANRLLTFILKAYGYGTPEMQDSLGKNTMLEKVLEPIRKLTYFQQIALNPISAFFSNLPVGQINNYLVASSKKFGLNKDFVLNASLEVAKEVIPILKATVGNTNVSDSHYLVKLASMFNAIAGLGVEAKDFREDKTDFQHYASYKSLFMLTTGTEVANQLPLMLGFMKSYELSPGYSMFDALRIDGETLSNSPSKTGEISLVDQAGNIIDKAEIARFAAKLSELLSRAQGDYGKLQKVKARYEYIAGLALTFGGWIYPSARTRFGRGKEIDYKTGTQDFGGYQSTFMANSFGTLNEFKEMFAFGEEETFSEFMKRTGWKAAGQALWGTAKVFGSVPLHVLNLMTGFRGQENEQFKKLLAIKSSDDAEFRSMFALEQLEGEPDEEFKKRVEEAYDFYINSLQTASKEYAIVIAFMIIGMMAKALTDDDDENDGAGEKFAKFLDVRSRQLVSDLSLFTPLISPLKPYDFLTQKSKDPFVILRTIDINTKFLYSLLGFQVNLSQGDINFVIDDRYDQSGPGYEKGDLKVARTATRAFGPLYQILRIMEPDQQAAYLKMINKGAVFTDKDLSNVDKDEEDEDE